MEWKQVIRWSSLPEKDHYFMVILFDNMSKIQDRKVQVLKHIVEEYLKTGEIMDQKISWKKYDLQVSSATVRNDMASLEDMGLIFQPYNSAGRLPTNRGLRVFVDYLMETMPAMFIEAEQELNEKLVKNRIDDVLYGLVARLPTQRMRSTCLYPITWNILLSRTLELSRATSWGPWRRNVSGDQVSRE